MKTIKIKCDKCGEYKETKDGLPEGWVELHFDSSVQYHPKHHYWHLCPICQKVLKIERYAKSAMIGNKESVGNRLVEIIEEIAGANQ